MANIEKDIKEKIINPIATEALKEWVPNDLESKEQHKQRLEKELLSSFSTFQEKIQSAVTLLKEEGKWPKKIDTSKIDIILEDEDKLSKYLQEGNTYQQALGLTDDQLISFYEIGYSYYKKERFNRASNIFFLLTTLNPLISSFWHALAMAEHQKQDFKNAMIAYMFSANLNEDNLSDLLSAADCAIALNDKEKAKELIHQVIQKAQASADLAFLKKEAEEIKASL